MATRKKVSETVEDMMNQIKPSKITIEASNPSIITIDGKKYVYEKETFKKIDNVEHTDKIIFKEFDEENYNYCLNLLIDTISENTAKKELIRELVKKIDYKTLRRLSKRIESGKAIKKQKGCLGLKIGDAYIQLVD